MHEVSDAAAPIAGRPPVELPPLTIAPGGRPVPLDDLVEEVAALAALLAEVVVLAGERAVFPGRWALIAELALEHASVRAALRAEETNGPAPSQATAASLSTERIIAELHSLRDQIEDGRARC